MEQCGRVKKIKGRFAEVEVTRSSACESCSAAHVCPSGRKDAVVRARNDAGAAVGDRVKLETPSGSVLKYAFAVFLFPLILAAAAFFAVSSFAGETAAVVSAAGGLVLAFAVVFFTLERSARKRGSVIVITEIEKKEYKVDKNEPDSMEGTI